MDADLFGTSSDEDDLGQDPQDSRPGSAPRLQPRDAIDEDEETAAGLGTAWSEDDVDDGQQAQEPASQAETTAGPAIDFDASINLSRPKAEDLKFVRQSNLLAIEQAPFDRDTFVKEEEKFLDEAGNTRIRLTGNTIRWRHATDTITGETYKQSNARFVRWSDGSLQLLLGSEVLDVAVQDIAADRNFMFSRQPQYIQVNGEAPVSLAKIRITDVLCKRCLVGQGPLFSDASWASSMVRISTRVNFCLGHSGKLIEAHLIACKQHGNLHKNIFKQSLLLKLEATSPSRYWQECIEQTVHPICKNDFHLTLASH